jgi:hypothetical protein
MVQRFGAKFGVGDLAQNITPEPSGHTHVAAAGDRRRELTDI